MKRFSDRRWRSHEMEPEANPLEFIANLADAMLILSVGFMLALVSYWNIDISVNTNTGTEVSTKDALAFDQKDMTKTDEKADSVKGGDLKKLGTVYYDSDTGKYYIIDAKEE